MSEKFESEYKIFEDINLENNKIVNVSEISSYDGKTGKYNSDVNNSGLYIHTPGNPTTVSKPNNNKGLIVTTGHAQTRLDKINNISNIIDNTINNHLDVKSNTKTDFMSPIIDIKSSDSDPNTRVLIRNVESSVNKKDNGIEITTDRTKIISTKSRNKTTKRNISENVESTILDFSSSVDSHIDLNRADIYQANTEIFVAGTKYGYSSEGISDAGKKESTEVDSENGNALYVDTEKVNIYVNTTIDNETTSITGELIQQTGTVEINKGVYEGSDPSTTIDGSILNVNTKTVNIGDLTSDSGDIRTKEINIGTASTNSNSRNILNIGSTYSDLTITGKDFLIDSDTDKTENIEVDTTVSNTAKSYLRSYYTNSNNSYIHDLLTIGPNNIKLDNSSSHLQLNGYADITGNLDVDGNIDVADTILFHSSGSEDSTTSYIKSNKSTDGKTTQNSSLQINNDTEVIISNAPKDGEDSNQISIKDDLIKTSKKLDLDADQNINGTLTFDVSKDIKDLNYIKTDTLEVSNNYSTDADKNSVFTIKTSSNNEEFSVDSKLIKLKSSDLTGNDNSTSGTVNEGKFKQTGNVFINTSNIYDTLIKGNSTSLESVTVNIGNETLSETINIGHQSSNVTVKGKNNFALESGVSESKITVDKVSISNSTNPNKVNIYWDPSSSTLIFEKG